jgi:two-component system response regulator AtoC
MSQENKSILCVDDERDICELIAAVVSSLNYTVVSSCCTYAEGLALAQSTSFDLYIISSGLTDGSGAELCREIRASNPQTPIIFTSAGNFHKEIAAAKAVGVNQILKKPFYIGKLEAVISKLLS